MVFCFSSLNWTKIDAYLCFQSLTPKKCQLFLDLWTLVSMRFRHLKQHISTHIARFVNIRHGH